MWVDPRGDPQRLQILEVKSGERRTRALRGRPRRLVGPDDEGRVAYVETFREPKPHFALRTLSLRDGAVESTVLERDGDIPLARDMAVALAPRGGRVAMVTRIHEGAFQYLPPQLSLVDVQGGAETFIESEVAVYRPYWFPDGRHLAIVEQRASEAAPIRRSWMW